MDIFSSFDGSFGDGFYSGSDFSSGGDTLGGGDSFSGGSDFMTGHEGYSAMGYDGGFAPGPDYGPDGGAFSGYDDGGAFSGHEDGGFLPVHDGGASHDMLPVYAGDGAHDLVPAHHDESGVDYGSSWNDDAMADRMELSNDMQPYHYEHHGGGYHYQGGPDVDYAHYPADGTYPGTLPPGGFHAPHTVFSAFGLFHVVQDFQGNLHLVLGHDDPLLHASEYRCSSFDITGGNGNIHEPDLNIHQPALPHHAPDHHVLKPLNPELVHVDGYFRDDGTYVQEHYRTAPDGIKENNLSYRFK